MGGWNPFQDSWGFGTGGWRGLEKQLKRSLTDFLLLTPWFYLHPKFLEETFRLFGFTGETIFTTQLITTRVIPEKQTPFIHKLLMRYVFQGDPYVEGFVLSLNTGIHKSTNRYLGYGERVFVNGVPTLTSTATGIPAGAVDAAIETIEGQPVTVLVGTIAFLPQNEWVKWWLQENTVFTYHDSQIILGAITYQYLEVVDGGSVSGGTAGTYTANFIDANPPNTATTEIHNIPYENGYVIDPTGPNPIPDPNAKTFIIATYVLNSAPSLEKIWIYDQDTRVFPDLNRADESGVQLSSILPVVALRKDFVDMNFLNFPDEYPTSRGILKKLELKVEQFTDSLNDPSNPGQIDKIQDAFFYYGLNIYSETESVIRAIREQFGYMESIQITDKELFELQEPNQNPIPNVFAVTEAAFNMGIQHNYIDTEAIAGDIGIPGYAESAVTILPASPIVGSSDRDSDESYGGLPQSFIVFREQMEPGLYLETTVHGLSLSVGIKTLPNVLKFNFIELEADGGVNRVNFTIPLIMTAIADLSPTDQEEVLYEAMCMSIYAVDSQDLKYYETAKFNQFIKLAVIITSIFVMIISFGSGSTLTASLWALAQNLAYQYALSLALQEILSHNLSDDERRLVLLFYTAAAAAGPSIVSYDFAALSFADSLLFAVDAVTQAVMLDVGFEANQLQQEIDQFNSTAEDRQDLLREANSRFSGGGLGVDPLLLRQTYKPSAYESPASFYNRAIHVGNPGVGSLDQIGDYHTRALALPELN